MANLTAEELKALEDQLNMEQLLIKYRSYTSMTATRRLSRPARISQICTSSILTS